MHKVMNHLYKLLLASVLTLPSCLACQKITVNKIYGIWIEDNKTCQSDCSQLEFFDDGHFEALNLPDSWFGYVRQYEIKTRFNATGSWSLKAPDQTLGKYQVDLYFKNIMVKEGQVSYHETIYMDPSSPRELYSWLGDESIRITFIKDGPVITKTP